MANDPNPNDRGGYGYYGGGYYYGEGYGDYGQGGGGGGPASRGLKEYMMMLRERFWLLIIIWFLVFGISIIVTMRETPKYRSVATVEILRQKDKAAAAFEDVVDQTVRNVEDFQTRIKLLESVGVAQRVLQRLDETQMRRFMQPYEDEFAWLHKRSPLEVLIDSRKVSPLRLTLMAMVQFEHPDAQMAALMANLFVQEFINHLDDRRIEGSMRAVDELKERAESQREKVSQLELDLADFKERYKSVSFDANTDIDQQELLQLNEMRTIDKRALDEAETQWALVQRVIEDGGALEDLLSVATLPQVQELVNRRSLLRIEVASLEKRYRHKHPSMIAAVEQLEQTEIEMQRALNSAKEKIYLNLQRAQENFANAQERIERKRQEIIDFQKVRVEYNALVRDIEVSRQLYGYLYSRMQQAMTQATDDAQSAVIVDMATPALRASTPRWPLNLAFGFMAGLGMGFGFVFLLGFLDDKVKSAFDIENTVGLPLIGIIPRITRSDPQEKAKLVSQGEDKHTVEAFRNIHSSLKLNEESRKARVILTTSTVPSEGKSFVTTNMAMTFAGHGERTLIIDGDLRMPNVARSLGLPNEQGLLQYMLKELPLDELIRKEVTPNLDVLVAGSRTKNPTQILGSAKFEDLLHELRGRYDKIIIDSPPLAPVSDALTILPLVDGVLYVVRFNAVKRKTAMINVRRLRESNVPVFGAILNNINTNVAGYYYSHYYDRSYSRYYLSDKKMQQEDDKDRVVQEAAKRRAQHEQPKAKV